MPLRRELAARYADALGALAAATHRTAVLADAHGDWVIDAFDDAYSALRQSAHWIASDIQRGALG